MKRTYSTQEAQDVALALNIDFSKTPFGLEEFRSGLDVEAEHGQIDSETNVTNDDPVTTGKIALAHLNEIPDYYQRLRKMELEAEADAAAAAPEVKASRRSWARFLPLGAIAVIGALVFRTKRGRAEGE